MKMRMEQDMMSIVEDPGNADLMSRLVDEVEEV